MLREAAFPPGDEIGNNFQLGVRSTAFRGVTFDLAGFHQLIDDFQIKGSTTDAAGNNIYTNLEEVEINGFEILGRLDSRAWGGPLNGSSRQLHVHGCCHREGRQQRRRLAGKLVPEVPRHFARSHARRRA